MQIINRDILKSEEQQEPVIPKRSQGTVMTILQALLNRTLFKVKLNNETELQRVLEDIKAALGNTDSREVLNRIQELTAKIGSETTVAKANIEAQSITDFRVNNLEELHFDKIEGVDLKGIKLSFGAIGDILTAIKQNGVQDQRAFMRLTELKDSLSSLDNRSLLSKISDGIQSLISKKDTSPIVFPDVQKITGEVKVTSLPDSVMNKGLVEAIQGLKSAIAAQGSADTSTLEKKLDELKSILADMPKKMPMTEFPSVINTNVVSAPPQKYPLPVTNININPLRGYTKSSAVTINAATPLGLPTTALANRRGIVIYNNSSNTVFIGGSDVTAANGMPIPANSYSPALDAGEKLIVYGITSSSTADLRILEVSNDKVGG